MYIQIKENGWDYLMKTVGEKYIKHCIENKKIDIENESWYKLQCHQVFDLFPMNFGSKPMININVMFDEKDLY